MKQIIIVFTTVLLLMSLITNAYAEGEYVYNFTINGIEICVKSQTYLNENEAYEIALSMFNDEGNNPGKGAWCTINGHTMHQSSLITTQHKYYSNDPRCLQKTFLVNTCSVCGYQESTLISSVRIHCCP